MNKLLLSTSLALVLASGVHAGTQAIQTFREAPEAQELRASEFIGMRVYTSETKFENDIAEGVQAGWEDIGEINDVILTRSGQIEAVLVDIGGFLGIGERQVAVDMNAIRMVSDNATPDDLDDFFLVMNVPRGDFESAPAYGLGQQSEAKPADATATVAETSVESVQTGFVEASSENLTAEQLTGLAAYDANDEWIGEVSQVVLTADGAPVEVIVDVGGFLGLGEKPVSLPFDDLKLMKAADGDELRVILEATKEQLEALPTYEG